MLLQTVQQTATKMTKCLEDMNVTGYVHVFNLTTLEARHVRGDLIEAFKICKSFEDVYSDLFFRRSELGLRSYKVKLVKPRA